MAVSLIQAAIVGDEIVFRFSMLDGLREWAEQETGSTFAPVFDWPLKAWPLTMGGPAPRGEIRQHWAYRLPATKDNAARLLLTAPTPIDCSDELQQLVGTIKEIDFAESSAKLSDAANLPQPPIRVFDQWQHQLLGYHFAKRRGCRAGLAMGMGTGKSKVATDLLLNEKCRRTLLLCPATVIGTWRGQFRQHGPQAEVAFLNDDYTVAKKVKYAQSMMEAAGFRGNENKSFALVINYESAIRPEFRNWSLAQQWDMVILDEAHKAKAPNGVTGEYIARLRLRALRRLAMSGTFMPHSPADLFSPFRFIDPRLFGDNYYVFLKRFAVTGFHKELLGWRHRDELRRIYHTGAIVIGSEVLDLPPVQHLEREFSLPKESAKIYKELWDEFCAVTANGVVTVDNALVKLLRAQQITSGFLPLDEEIGEELDPTASDRPRIEILNNAKELLLADLLEDVRSGDPVVVFCKYRYDLDSVRRAAERVEYDRNGVKFGDTVKRDKMIAAGDWVYFRCGEVSGRKKDLTAESKLPEGFDVFAVQEQSGGVGVDFTRSCMAVLYSIGFSLGNYEQMLARLVRPGQTRPVRFYHLIATKTVDRRIRQSLRDRKRVVDSISEAIDAGTLRSWTETAA